MAPCEWVIDIIQEWVIAQGYLTTSFVDRGDPAVNDFAAGDFIANDLWHDLDLSGIVPSNAKAVLFSLSTSAFAINFSALFRKKGNINTTNISIRNTLVAGVPHTGDYVCPIGTNGKLEYNFTTGVWPVIFFTVKGWWL